MDGQQLARCMGGRHCIHAKGTCTATVDRVSSSSDDRTANNTGAVRHDYRVLSEEEKAAMVAIKDKGAELLELINRHVHYAPREAALARTNAEQAVMWAVKGLTA